MKQVAPGGISAGAPCSTGPTLAFKDFAIVSLIHGQMFEAALKRSGRRLTVGGGSHERRPPDRAAIEAFRGMEAVDVFILLSQRAGERKCSAGRWTTPVESNVHALALHGDFDDCQARVKDMFNDLAFRDEVATGGGQFHQLGAGAGAEMSSIMCTAESNQEHLARRIARWISEKNPCPRAISATNLRRLHRAARKWRVPVGRAHCSDGNTTNECGWPARSGDGEYRKGRVEPSRSPVDGHPRFPRISSGRSSRPNGAETGKMRAVEAADGTS